MKVLMLMLVGMMSLSMLSAITASAAITATSIDLHWTAPGDDGTAGTATAYDVRYSTSPITAANFASATQATGAPTPLISGTAQSMTVAGLTPATLYYFALKARDAAGNWALISNVVSQATLTAPDVTRPAPIALTMGMVTDSTAVLNWTAVGDDSLSGTITSYDIRYSTTAITAATWAAATQVPNEPTPLIVGSAQTYTVTGLSRRVTYYFAIRASDEVGNTSALSNVPSVVTPDTAAPSTVSTLTAS